MLRLKSVYDEKLYVIEGKIECRLVVSKDVSECFGKGTMFRPNRCQDRKSLAVVCARFINMSDRLGSTNARLALLEEVHGTELVILHEQTVSLEEISRELKIPLNHTKRCFKALVCLLCE